jgi:nucleoside-diphosphate-sugar epimerase
VSRFTVLGGHGFIGRHLVARIAALGHEVQAPERGSPWPEGDLGHVVYAVGLTADFRTRSVATVDAHVNLLARLVDRGRFQDLLYLSSTRVYKGLSGEVAEEAALCALPQDGDDLYNLSKMMGEALCLQAAAGGRVARLSNVYGPGPSSPSFLASVVDDAVRRGRVVLHTSLDSEKDYVPVDQVADLLVRIALQGRQRVYNIASGRNVAHRAVMDRLRAVTGCTVEVPPGAPRTTFPPISVQRAVAEFGWQARRVEDGIAELVQASREGMVQS